MRVVLLLCCLTAGALGQGTASASYVVDFAAATTPFPHAWEECVGSGRAALQQAHTDLGVKRVRFHGVFDDDMNVALPTGTSFYNVDNTYDFLFSIGMAPFVELGFSPVSMSTNNRTTFHYKANISPPQVDKWTALVSDFAAHLVERYGAATAESLLFEVWNEYNCGFLNATDPRQAYYDLYSVTALALKKAHPKLQVGGPATCMSQEVDLFLQHCHANNLPVDFVTTHIYPTDPAIVNGRIGSTLRATTAQVANSAFPNAPLLYSEFNDGLFGNPAYHDMPFAASWMVKTMSSLDGGKGNLVMLQFAQKRTCSGAVLVVVDV